MIKTEETDNGLKIYCSRLERGRGFLMPDADPETYNDFALVLDKLRLIKPRLGELVDLLDIAPDISDNEIRNSVLDTIMHNQIFGFELALFLDKKEIYIIDDSAPRDEEWEDILDRRALEARLKTRDKSVRKLSHALDKGKIEFLKLIIGDEKLEKLYRASGKMGVNKARIFVPPLFCHSEDSESKGYAFFSFDDINSPEDGIVEFEIGFDSFDYPMDGRGVGYSFGIFS